MPEQESRKRWMIIAAFAAVYIIWGSTYLAIAIGIETFPGWLMIGIRFLAAGSVMFVIARVNGGKMPTFVGWRTAAIVGILLLVGGNGGVVWAEQKLPSGLTALIIAIIPLWINAIDHFRPDGNKLTRRGVFGLALGMTGLVILIGPSQLREVLAGPAQTSGAAHIDLLSVGVLLLATIAWSFGTVYPRMKSAKLPESPLMATAAEMLSAGVAISIIALATGQVQHFDPASISLRSWLALAYLIVFGSIVAFTAYVWLVNTVKPAQVATYAYVNPVIAVILGALILSEPLNTEMLIATPIIILGVALINTGKAKAPAVENALMAEPVLSELRIGEVAAVAEK